VLILGLSPEYMIACFPLRRQAFFIKKTYLKLNLTNKKIKFLENRRFP
jgi:hypothetical protein